MIVKVQLALVPNTKGPRRALIYNEDRTVVYECDAGADLLKLMHGRPNAYFAAQIINTKIHLGEEMGRQDW